ncbi:PROSTAGLANDIN REDUCTASE [Salix koriyanagi]|uniref:PROSTAGLANDIN REDUCTASE n=1 Tax=Salix koriyanagi TaxID=2511006 RepID=A0A9Q0WSY2_9ROSI|nr:PROSTAGLANDIN REDUCTASE [Salix koriyanagi]
MQGFLQSDYLHLYPRFFEHVVSNFKQGKIVYIEDMSEGLESAPAAFAGLFSGKNVAQSFIYLRSFNPALVAASEYARLCKSVKYDGTLITQSVTGISNFENFLKIA